MAERSESVAQTADRLGGVVGGTRRRDGSWLCACGEDYPNDVALFLHRQGVPHDELREKMQAAWRKAADRGGGNTPSLVIDICAAIAREHFDG